MWAKQSLFMYGYRAQKAKLITYKFYSNHFTLQRLEHYEKENTKQQQQKMSVFSKTLILLYYHV